MPLTPQEIESHFAERRAERTRSNALNAPAVAPDDMARAMSHAQRTGEPVGVVAESVKDYDDVAALDEVAEAGRSPWFSAWATPDRIALAKDDIGPLSRISKLSESLRQSTLEHFRPGSRLALLAQAGDPNLAPHLAKRFQVADVGMVADTLRMVGETADRLLNPGRQVAESMRRDGVAITYRGDDTFRDVADSAAAVGREVRADQQALGQVYARGQIGYHAGQIADSLPQMTAAAVLRDPRLAAGAMGLFTQARGVSDAMDAGQSFGAANLESAIPTAAEIVGSRLTFGRVFGEGNRLLRMGTAGVTEAGGEAATEFAQATYEARNGVLDPVETLWRTLDAAIAGGGTGATVAAIAPRSRQQVETLATASRSLKGTQGLRAFTEAAGESKTVQRAPAEVEALVGDAGAIYIPVEQARLLFQSEDFDTWAAELTGDPDQSAADSGDLRIPAAKWASTIARLPNAAEWVKHARTEAEGFSAADLEAADFLEREFGVDPDIAAANAAPVDPESAARIEQDVMGQLIGTGRYREADAQAQAQFMAKVFGTLASREGLDAFELYQSYNPAIRDGSPRLGRPNTLDARTNALVDAVRTGRIPDGPEVHGKTLLAFLKEQGGLVDEGGELRARDAGKLRPGLVSLAGLPLDTARELAVEAEFLPADADLNDLLDAIDRELKGEAVTSPQFENRQAREFRDEARQLQAQIDEAFADMTADEFDALSNQEIADRLAGESPRGLFARAKEMVGALYQRATGSETLHQPADGGPITQRGGIELFDPSNVTIHLFASADRSTFLHEGAHFYLQVMADLASRDGASEQVRTDLDTVLRWGGIEGETAEARLAAWRAMPIDAQRHAHEAFAEGFEQYLLEGKAPSQEAATLFGKFRAWLVAVYGALRRHRVPLTDDVRQVFDRLVATDAEIEAAKPAPAFTDEQLTSAGFTPDEIAAHRAKLEAAIEAAQAKLASQTLKAYERERKAWWKAERQKLREELEAQAGATPAVQAFRALRSKGGPKLSLAGLKDLLTVIPENWPKGLTSPQGQHPDTAAMLLGFSSGSELVQALQAVPDLMARLDEQADALMRERHGDPMVDGTLPEKAMVAAHNSRQVRALEDELRILEIMAADPTAVPEKAKGEPKTSIRAPMSPQQRASVRAQAAQRAHVGRAFKALAERKVAGLKVRDLKPNEHLAAEKRAMRQAIEATNTGDFVAAAKAKREQILHASLYRASRDAQTEATKGARYHAKLQTAKARAKLGKAGDYLEQVDALHERFDFRKVSDKASARRQSFRAWVEAQQAAGVPVDVPEHLLDDANRMPFREMTVAELRDLTATVRHLVHLAGLKNRLLLKGELRDREAIDAAMAESVRAHHADRQRLGLPTLGDRAHDTLMKLRAVQGAATDIARELDGFEDVGAVWSHTVGVIRDAVHNRLNPALQAEQEAIASLYLSHYSKAELRQFGQRRERGALGGWTKESILALALNWGNAGNREAILTQAKSRLSAEQVGALLGELDARDWQFVQAAWLHIDMHWPALAEAHRRRTGLPLKKVEAAPFTVTTKDGQTLTLPGGYYPLKYDGARAAKSLKNDAEDEWNRLRSGRTAKASTKDGHRKERVGSGGQPVRLDLGVLDQHVREVQRDLHLADAVNYVHATLNGSEFTSALEDVGALPLQQAMESWLKDAATGELGVDAVGLNVGRFIRSNFTAAALTYRVSSALLQITGLSQSLVVLGPKLGVGVQRVLRYPKSAFSYVDGRSPMMKARAQGHQDAVLAVANARAGAFVAGHAAMIRYGYWMMGKVQRIVDVATWIAAEADARERGMSEADAGLFADDVVTRAQGTQEFIDKTPLQRGTFGDRTRQSELIKSTTMLAGYMIAKGNLIYEQTRRTQFRKPGQALKWATHLTLLLVFEQMVGAAIRGKLPDDEEEDGLADDLALWSLGEASLGLLGSIPGFGSVASTNLRGYGSGGALGELFDAFRKAVDQAGQGELDEAAVKATVRAVGQATGAPASQINATITTIQAARDGQDVNAYHYLVGPPKND